MSEPFELASEPRVNLDELESDLRARLLALDEPVTWADWQEVVGRSQPSRPWRGLVTIGLSVVAVAAVAVAGVVQLTRNHADSRAAGHDLYVSPAGQGKFCYRWQGVSNGCEDMGLSPLDVSWGRGQVVGAVAAARISSVTISFTDGTSVVPDISWISTPVEAGFFFYRIPAGKRIAAVNGYDHGRVSRRVTWFSV